MECKIRWHKAILWCFIFFSQILFNSPSRGGEPVSEPQKVLFTISELQIEGNTIFPPEKIRERVSPFEGENKEMEDVEKARASLEKAYHDAGYPTVLVVVPEQTIQNGVVKMTVIESKIGEVSLDGNRYFSRQRILEKLPSIRPGALLYEPEVIKELNQVNSNPDLEVTPVLIMGSQPGTVDLQLKAKDRLPLHGSLEWNNRMTPNSPQYRLNSSIQYTNLFDRDHILTLNTMQSPDNWGLVQVYGLSYVAPVYDSDHLLIAYGARSETRSVLNGSSLPVYQGDISITGNATIFGARYLFPLWPGNATSHQLSIGIEYKQIGRSDAAFPGGYGLSVANSPVNYAPVSVTYNLSRSGSPGSMKLLATVKGNRAGVVPGGGETDFGGDPSDPVNQPGNRKGATGTFVVVQAGSEFFGNLPEGMALSFKADGQAASEPLIPAEQYFAGGVESVRGYLENEVLGDNAVRGSLELLSPSYPPFLRDKIKGNIRFAAFYDVAYLSSREIPAGQTDHYTLEGTGVGLRFKLTDNFQASLDEAWALDDAAVTHRGDHFTHFSLKVAF
ncbi:MAG: ShlB/FhaC/HecB family hemolysin secretion/activation protein [Nitrospiria bacterium]